MASGERRVASEWAGVAADVCGFFCLCCAATKYFEVFREVNEARAHARPFLDWSYRALAIWDFPRAMKDHSSFFPRSRLRLQFKAWLVAGFICIVFGGLLR